MTTLGLESRLVQNPALGAVVLWRFVHKYTEAHALRAATPFCLCALVLPMVWHAETAENIVSTREASGLRAFSDKFSDTRDSKRDTLLALHDRTARWQDKTMNSLRVAMGCGLLRFNGAGGLVAGDIAWQPAKHPQTVRVQANVAEKLGAWFAALSLLEIAAILRVRF